MAFSLKKMLSNISYFTKPGENSMESSAPYEHVATDNRHQGDFLSFMASEHLEFHVEADSSTKCASSLILPESVKHYAANKSSLSDTDLLNIHLDASTKQEKKKCRKLNVDIQKADLSLNGSISYSEGSSLNIENTPKHKLLESKGVELFKNFNFNQSFDISDAASVATSFEEEIDIQTLSDQSDSDISAEDEDDNIDVKMCRKVDPQSLPEPLPSATPESFADVEVDKNEEERLSLLLKYQTKLDKIDSFLKKLLTEFEFHIEVSKIFNCKSIVTALPGADVTNIPKTLGDVKYIDNIQRGISPIGWNIVMEREDLTTKMKLKNQLQAMKHLIGEFIMNYLEDSKPKQCKLPKHASFNQLKGHCHPKKCNISYKKKIKHFDFPDLRDAMLNLFTIEESAPDHDHDAMETDSSKCSCRCHASLDSELVNSDKDTPNHSITSSIGNFTLDSTTLSAYSESLDQIVSYNSFNDTNSSLFNTLHQKAAIERITFYIQVHSIQLKCEPTELDFESKAHITFHCSTCKTTMHEENDLMKHILSPSHCEKIHFVYKTAYVKKCISMGKEIQPSTILNPMTMYRDDNKIVCFGDASYACSLCFENLIVGESVLIAHCSDYEHVNRREMLLDIFD